MSKKKCSHCVGGYVRDGSIYYPCNHCMSPERFLKTLEKAIKDCSDPGKKIVLRRIKANLPEYPVMALLEAENYEGLNKEFVKMLKSAFDIKPFMDVKYRGI